MATRLEIGPEGSVLSVCPRCEFGNPPGAVFCGACGAPLVLQCARCGTSNPPRFRFCGGCGAALEAAVPGAQVGPAAGERARGGPAVLAQPAATLTGQSGAVLPGAPLREAPDVAAERRQLTVMFCDLVGSTALSLLLDPEELHEMVRSYQAVCAEASERFDGYVAQYLGDGVLVYFGYPVALENEAECAVLAALRVLEQMASLNARLRERVGVNLAVRIGIHTGLVVVGEVGGGARRENLALGGTPNIAARLQTLASANSVVISAVTQRLVGRRFECEDLGPVSLPGVSGIGSVYRVLGERDATTRQRAPLIGRQSELALLESHWREALAGRGRAVMLIGDAGIGKSHLIEAFVEAGPHGSPLVLATRCLPYYQNTAFHPIITLLERELSLTSGLAPEEALHHLAAMLERNGMPVAETLPLFAALLGLPPPPGASQPAGPEAQREMTRAALLRLLLGSGTERPVVLVVEDLHWADPSTFELFERAVPRLGSQRLLLLFTVRPGFEPGWAASDTLHRISLTRLPPGQAERIIGAVAGKPVPAEVVQQIVERTDGVPLFVEELTRTVLQSGLLVERDERWELTGPLPPLAIPDTLQDSLEARLDRLAAVKEIAQLGATIGREFTYPVLRAVAQVEDSALTRALEQLTDAGLIQKSEARGTPTYTFRHALIQEAAYESLLRSTRHRYHQRIAQVIEREFPQIAQNEPETLAHHWTAAELPERAVPYWLRAGQRALLASANAEAAGHLQHGLEQLARLPESPERLRLEIELQASLGTALIASKGYTSPDVKHAFDRARELAGAADDPVRLAPVMTGLFAYYTVRGELDAARQIATEFDADARQHGGDGLILLAETLLGIIDVTSGRLQDGRAHLERVLAGYDTEKHARYAYLYGHDLRVLAYAYTAWLLNLEGRSVASRNAGEAGIAHARSLHHPHSLAFALAFAGAQCRFRGEIDEAAAIAEELIPLANEWRFRHWLADALLLQAWVLAERGQREAAIERMEEGIRIFGPLEGWRSQFYSLMQARTNASLGRWDHVHAFVEPCPEGGCDDDWWWLTEHCEIMADVLAQDPARTEEAANLLRRGIERAAPQGAHMCVLRYATRLGRILARTGRADEAVQRLEAALAAVPVEEPDLRDLVAAEQLLASLRSGETPAGA